MYNVSFAPNSGREIAMPNMTPDIWREYTVAGGTLITSAYGEEIFVEGEIGERILEHGTNVFHYGGNKVGRGHHAMVIELGGHVLKGGAYEQVADGDGPPVRRDLQQAWVDTVLSVGFARLGSKETDAVEWSYPTPYFYWTSHRDAMTHVRGMQYFDLPNGLDVAAQGHYAILPAPKKVANTCDLAVTSASFPVGHISYDEGYETESAPHGRRLGNILIGMDESGESVKQIVKIDCFPYADLADLMPH